MNSYFFKMTNEERDNILDQHKEIYDGYVTSYQQQPKEQPLYTQDFANDKKGINVNNRGEVSTYSNLNINEMRHDGKSTGLFSSEENEDYMSPGTQFDIEPTFESEEEEYMVSVGAPKDMIGDGIDDLEHGVFGYEDDSDMVLVTPEAYDDQDYYESEDDEDWFSMDLLDDDFDEDFDDENKEDITLQIKESLDMFKRFTKYN